MKEKFVYTGKSVLRGVELAKSKYPKLDLNIELVQSSDNLHEVTKETQKAINKFKPLAIVGAITSNVAFAISELAEKHKIPFITPYATNSKVTEGKKYTFRACFDDAFQAKTLAQFSKNKLKKKNALVIIKGSSSYSLGIGKDFAKEFETVGGSVEVLEVEKPSDLTIDQLATIKKKKFDLVFLPHYQMEATAFLSKLALVVGQNADFLGPDSWAGGKLFRDIIAQNTFNGKRAYFSKHYSEKYESTGNKEFLKALSKLKKDKNEKLYYKAATALGYDAGKLIFSALAKKIDLLSAIKASKINGATGNINFKSGGTPDKGLFVFRIDSNSEKLFTYYGEKL